ncbi:MAG TPA: MotA/TolQ/ExbB proton channel family protein [Opitutales bacterium]|nr:MotA/TolQ/ExbB proton channel family protein [Opitutales bacterium]
MNIFDLSAPMMWPLFALSVLGFVFFLERALFLHKGQIRTTEFLEGIKTLARKRRMLEALTVCEETPGPVAAVVKASLMHYREDEPRLRGAIQAMALVEIPTLERRLGTIALIAKIAPLLGLLGTVLGLLRGFALMNANGPYANAADFAGIINAALATTAAGLAIAIMAYLAHHFLYGRVRALVHDMEWVGNEMLQFLLVDLPATPAPAAEPGDAPAGLTPGK